MHRKHPLILHYVRIGQMPLYWLKLRGDRGVRYYLMLLQPRQLRQLLRTAASEAELKNFGRVIFYGSGSAASDAARELLKQRFATDIKDETAASSSLR